jgi:hypothetical protein
VQVKRESKVLAGAIVYFAGYNGMEKEEAEKLVVSLGGEVAMTHVPSKVTHILAGGWVAGSVGGWGSM